MIKAMDEILQHWADQHRGQGMRQCSPLGRLVEFGGIPPRSCNPQASRDPLNLGEMDELGWQVEQALQRLDADHRVIAHEHYRFDGYSDEKARRLGLAQQTYYDRLHRLHEQLQYVLMESNRPRRRA